MANYHNVMEEILEQEFDALKDTLSGCHCENCRNDIIAHALNNVKPRYVVTRQGDLMSKIEQLKSQERTDLRSALIRASMMVAENPRH